MTAVTIKLDSDHWIQFQDGAFFDEWRNRLAEAAGYHLSSENPTPIINWRDFDDGNFLGAWKWLTPSDPLMVLVVHDAHQGSIFPEHAARLADRIEELYGRADVSAEEYRTFVELLRLGNRTGLKLRFLN